MNKTKIAFAGGGSGGHVYPLIAVADEIRKKNPAIECFFISTKGSIEERIVPKANYPLELIPSGKLKSQGILKSLITLFVLPFSFFLCMWKIFRKRPDFVFSAGGYAGAPYLVSAALLGVPCAVLEQNRVPGMANKWMAKFCKIVFVNFAASKEYFAEKNVQVVGHPYRKEIESAVWSESESAALWEKNPFHIFIFGGSQGAVGINRLVTAALNELKDLPIFFHHQTGVLDFETVKKAYLEAGMSDLQKAKVEQYVYDMVSAYKNAHLVICRAGASSIAELAVAKKASLLIPLVSKDNHQVHNAKEVAERSAAAFFLQPDLTGSKLAAIIKEFYHDRVKLKTLAENIAGLHHAGSAEKIATALLQF